MCHHASATKDAYVSNVRILKFSVYVRRWIEANDLRPQVSEPQSVRVHNVSTSL